MSKENQEKQNDSSDILEDFDLNEQYSIYLKLVKLNEEKMPTRQKIETKRAYMAGMAQMHVNFIQMGNVCSDGEIHQIEQHLTNQLNKFWNEQ